MSNSSGTSAAFISRLNRFTGFCSIAAALLLLPFVFSVLFSTGLLRGNEKNGLWIASLLLLLAGILFISRKEKITAGKSLFCFSLLLLLFLELLVRLSVHFFSGEDTRKKLEEECNYTYPQQGAYTGHPFTQFTGQSRVALKGNKALGNLSPYNNFGFAGNDFSYEKAPGTIRIACLGESTTADGYPAFLENYLNQHGDSAGRYQVYNFGHAYWTTAHSLVTFVLTAVDFKPDYVVIHHGWNEEKIRDAQPGEFRNDYSHAFKSWEQPVVYDRYLIRCSLIYRYFKFKYDQSPEWTTLGGYITKKRKRAEPFFANTEELKPFKRNIETEIKIALADGIRPVLTTLPHSTDEQAAMFYGHTSIDQCNTILREIAAMFSGKIIFVDLDSAITGKRNAIFTDLGHVTDEGRTLKAQLIGAKILENSKTPMGVALVVTEDPSNREDQVQLYIQKIKNDPPWLESVKQKAKERNIPLEQMFRLDAEYMIQQESLQKK